MDSPGQPTPSEVIEIGDELEPSGRIVVGNSLIGRQSFVKNQIKLDREHTRSGLVNQLLRVIALEVIVGALLLAFAIWTGSNTEVVKDYLSIIFPVSMSVFSGVVAFYFGKEKGRKKPRSESEGGTRGSRN